MSDVDNVFPEETLRKIILEKVSAYPGIRGTVLVTEVLAAAYKSRADERVSTPDIVPLLSKLVEEGELVEVEYVLSSMNYRVKSLYFPKGTEIRIVSPPTP